MVWTHYVTLTIFVYCCYTVEGMLVF